MASRTTVDHEPPSLKTPDFESLKRLKNYLLAIRNNHAQTLEFYLSEDGFGFFHQSKSRKEASRSSTATCIASLVRAGLWTDDSKWSQATSAIADHHIRKPWESSKLPPNNPFTVAFVVEGILDLREACKTYANVENHIALLRTEANRGPNLQDL
jgi:hypothetical protein